MTRNLIPWLIYWGASIALFGTGIFKGWDLSLWALAIILIGFLAEYIRTGLIGSEKHRQKMQAEAEAAGREIKPFNMKWVAKFGAPSAIYLIIVTAAALFE
ncbi:MAG: hypothetical protein RR226_06090 [Oscillospiraceae bacterium]